MANNNQINNVSYYQLPCGRQLEDFIWWRKLNFAEGCALKYIFRAGNKDKEPSWKDIRKHTHYCDYVSKKAHIPYRLEVMYIESLLREAIAWDGIERGFWSSVWRQLKEWIV